jgi:hypothetical protein
LNCRDTIAESLRLTSDTRVRVAEVFDEGVDSTERVGRIGINEQRLNQRAKSQEILRIKREEYPGDLR